MDRIDLKISGDLHVKTLCRLCLTVAKDNSVSIFQESDVHSFSMERGIKDCIGLEMSENDGLPPHVCNLCASKITEWYEFKQNAKRSDQSLRQLLLEQPSLDDDDISCSGDLAIKEEDTYSEEDEDDDVPLSRIVTSRKYVKRVKKEGKSKAERSLGARGRAPKAKPFCQVCNVKFVRFPEYMEHQQEVHGWTSVGEEVPTAPDSEAFVIYRCHICKDEFKDRAALRAHCKTQHNVKVIHPYGCSHCERQFPSWSLLVVHERQHTGEKPYSCDLCGKENFVSQASLRRHKLMHLKVYSCQQCGRDFNCDSALKAHIRCKHTNEKPFLCNVCGRSFSLATILNAHMTSHSSERKYKCEICGFRSKTSGNHHRHRARHLQGGAKIFHCETCGKAFETKLKLSSHLVIHKPERPHLCKLCGKRFLYNNKLERHILTVHARERPYPCVICGRKLASKFGLGIHLKTHTKGMQENENEVEQEQTMEISLPDPVMPEHCVQIQEVRLLIN